MRIYFRICLTLWVSCLAYGQSPQKIAKALVTEHDQNKKAWQLKYAKSVSEEEKQLLLNQLETNPQYNTRKYAEVLVKKIDPYLRNGWTVPYMAWLIRNHPQLTFEKDMGSGKPPKVINRENIYMQYFETNHIGSSDAGEFVISLLFRVNEDRKVQQRKLEIAEKVYGHHGEKNKQITGVAAFACGMLTSQVEGDTETRKKILRYLTTAVQHASDYKIDDFSLTDALNEKFHVMNNLEVGRPVPLFKGQDAVGREHSIIDYKRNTVLLIFWSHQMNNYAEFASNVNGMVKANAGKPFKVLGVTTDDVTLLRNAIGENSMHWRNFVDVKGKVTKEFRADQIPYCYIISKAGTIVYRGGLGGPRYFHILSTELEGEAK